MNLPFFLGRRIIISKGVESSPKAIGFKIGTRNEFATGKKSIWNPFGDIFSRRLLVMFHEEGLG
jgi:hypothetical protein